MTWKAGKISESSMGLAAMVGVVGASIGGSANMGLQNIQAFGWWAAKTGSRLGLMGLDWSRVGQAMAIGAGVGVTVAVVALGADKLKSWRSRREAGAALAKANGPKM